MRIAFLVLAAICFAVATLIVAWPISGNFDAWLAGGLLSYVLSRLWFVAMGGATPRG